MEQHDEPTQVPESEVMGRLRALGRAPLEPDVAQRCATRVRRDQRRKSRVRKAGLIGALAAAMVVGSVGLAAADTLPDPVQQAAHDALGKVGVNVPPGQDRYNDPAACPGGPYRNHGAYVRAHKNDPNAGQSPCGKPKVSMHDKSGGAAGDSENDGTQSEQGPPPWAHGHGNGKGNGADHGKGKDGQPGHGHAGGQGDDEQGDGSDSSSPNAGAPDTAPTSPTTSAPAPTVPPTTAPAPVTTTVAPTTTTTTSVPGDTPTP